MRLKPEDLEGKLKSFNPRTPCGVRPSIIVNNICSVPFQSTHSLRSATFSPGLEKIDFEVSIHALLAECDLIRSTLYENMTEFQSTHSLRSATWLLGDNIMRRGFQSTHSLRSATMALKESITTEFVSIHALLAECDWIALPLEDYQKGFNPRTPCGVRPDCTTTVPTCEPFQSTHSLRSATGAFPTLSRTLKVSIHALLAECDCRIWKSLRAGGQFQSTHSLRSATEIGTWRSPTEQFQSTHSLRSATFIPGLEIPAAEVSIHALLAECDARTAAVLSRTYCFNPRTPCGVRLSRYQRHDKL